MSAYNWSKLISRLAFLAQSYRKPDGPIRIVVDGKELPPESFSVETAGAGDIRLVVNTKAAPINPERPRLGLGRPRKVKVFKEEKDEAEVDAADQVV